MRVALTLTLFALCACTIGAPKSAEVSSGTCLGSPYRPDPPAPDTGEPYEAHPSLSASASGSTVTLLLAETTINCCPSPAASWTVSDDTYEVEVLSETSDSACGCMCVMDLSVDITEVPSGTWTFDVTLDGDVFGTTTATVTTEEVSVSVRPQAPL